MQSSFSSWKNVFFREIKRMGSRPLYVLATVILPLLGFFFFISLFSSAKPVDLPIVVVDYDQSVLSRQVIHNIDLGATAKVTQNMMDLKEAKISMVKGDCYGILIIPKDFYKKVLRNEQPEVIFYSNNAYMIVGNLLSAEINQIMATFSAGIDFKVRQKKGENIQKAKAAVNPISVDGHRLFNPYLNYFYYLATAFLPIMLLMFILLMTVYVIGVEYKQGTANEWLSVANGSIIRALSAKLLPYFFIWIILMLFMNAIFFKFFSIPIYGSSFLLIMNSVLFVIAYMAVGIFIAAVFPALRMGLSMASVYSALAFSFSGLTFPFIAMYKIVAFLGHFFPYTHYIRVFLDQSLRAAPISSSFESLLYLNLFFILPFTVLFKLKKMCKNEKFWGKF